MKPVVLDASAILASIYFEKGYDLVDKHLTDALVSTVNLTEVIENMLSKEISMHDVKNIITKLPLVIIDYNQEHAFIAANLRKETRHKGLSLGDRACLAIAKAEKLTVLTADKAWEKLDVGVKIQVIR